MVDTSPSGGADWPEAVGEETTPQENNDSATEEGEGEVETEAKTNSSYPQPWPMAKVTQPLEGGETEAHRAQAPVMTAEESLTEEVDEEVHTEGVGQPQEDGPLTVTVETLTIPSNLRHLYLPNSDTDTGRNSEAESNRSDRDYVNVRPTTTFSSRSWRKEGNPSD